MNNLYGENLKIIRKHLNKNIDELAKMLNIPARTLGGYERGERTPSIEIATRLSKLSINLNWFCTGNGEMFIQKESIAPTDSKISDDELETKINAILKKHGVI